ncbi:unnamed protein product [Pneumocystis jirovecii]|uniref:SNF7 family protein n=2 Tax=Pneumocystis jirovecii TaxID=42068 RepID=L0P997_PNEJI|nr:uncharacterized protein T551_00850 [Pneumocystis jirovecii RU7]KTW32168.1 hypothetical protein T551_00850 [Pneumocystis jirovecii RU7]CCJ28933.1 unnamed protein product [Pneumocystis jirovecii]
MNRLFGLQRTQPSSETLGNAIKTTDARIRACEEKIHQCDAALQQALQQAKRQEKYTNSTSVLENAARKRALMHLRQKKLYEQQLSQLQMQQINMEQAMWAETQAHATRQTVAALKHANKELRRQPMQLDKIEQLQDSVADALAEVEEIQRALARPYDLDSIDETALDAELDALELDELNTLTNQIDHTEQIKQTSDMKIPSYLTMPILPEVTTTHPNQKDAETAI